MIKYLNTELKLFKVEYSTEYDIIVALSLEDAKRYWFKELGYGDDVSITESDIDIIEIDKDSSISVELVEDTRLYDLINYNRRSDDHVTCINVWNMLIYDSLVENMDKPEDNPEIPYLISTTNI